MYYRVKRWLTIFMVTAVTLTGFLWVQSIARAATPTGSTINTHTVMVDGQNKIVSWVANQDQAYATVAASAWNFLLNDVPKDDHGLPGYYTHSYFNPDTRELSYNPHGPASMNAMLTESALEYYQYSGDARVLTLVQNSVTYHLDHGLTAPTDNWANVPYASSDYNNTTYNGAARGNTDGVGDGTGVIEPDKVGELGVAFVQLYKTTGQQRYLTAAIDAANALASHVRTGDATQSPWPFRVKASDGSIKEQYTAHVVSPIELFDDLVELGQGNTALYQSARATAWTWLMQYPMQNNNWSTYFEDVNYHPAANNDTQMNSMMTARYLLLHPEYDANWESHVRGLIAWTEQRFAVSAFGANTIQEQADFAHPMGSHTSRYCSVNALLYQKTGDLAAKEKAYRACNWSTYMARSNGVDIDGPEVNNSWFTDGYGDYIRHFMVAMGAVPDWAPAGQNHVLQTTSVVTNVTYGPSQLSYTAYDPAGIEVIKTASAPTGVAINGVSLAQRSDLTAEGWTYDAVQSVVRVRRDAGQNVTIALNGSPVNLLPNVSLNASGTTFTAPANFSLQATATDSDGTISKVEFYQNGTLVSTVTNAPYSFALTNVPVGTYTFSARAYDSQGANSTSSTVTVTVNDPAQGGNSWTAADIGSTGVTGSTSTNGGTVTVKGGGTDIWGTADSFHFGYQQMTGDGEIKARVLTQQNTDSWALAGVMIRDSLAPGAKEALAALTPGHGLAFDYRSATNGNTTYVDGGAGTAPTWVRLVRSGTTITAAKSTNSTTWTTMGTATISFGTTAYVGLAVTSHNPSVLSTATFDSVSFTGQATGGDTTAPTISGITVSNVNANGATVSWTTNEPASSQIEFGPTTAYSSSTTLNTSLDTTHTQVVPDLSTGTTYHYRVKSADAAGNLSVSADGIFTTPAAPDTEAPTAPTGLIASAITATQATLNWTAATDNVAVAKYIVKRDGVIVGQPTGTSYTDTTLAGATTYSYTVAAQDAAGNISALSNAVVVTTPPAPISTLAVDTQVIAHTTTPSTTITSPALTTGGTNELLVAFVSSDGPSGTSSFSSVTTTGLTWTLRKRQNTQAGTSEIWTAPATAKLTGATIKATRTGSYRSSLVVTAFKGADLTTIGATAGASAATGAASANLTTTRAGSWVWAVGNDWDNALTRTVGTGQTKVDEFLTASGDTLWVQRCTTVASAAGTVVTINDTAPTTDRWNLALIEILPTP